MVCAARPITCRKGRTKKHEAAVADPTPSLRCTGPRRHARSRARQIATRLCLPARRRFKHRAGHSLRNERQLHWPSLCPAMAPANACCAARPLKRSKAHRPNLRDEHLGLKVYDCYRPTRAVRAMANWAHDGDDSEVTRRFYPALHKRNLFALGYISAQSRHSTGTTVDLTLIRLPRRPCSALRLGGTLRTLHRSRQQTRTRQQSRHGHGLRLF